MKEGLEPAERLTKLNRIAIKAISEPFVTEAIRGEVEEIFETGSLLLQSHVDHLNRSIQRVVSEGHFDRYQAEQVPTVNPFHNCVVILSFLGLENNKAEFYGAYRVNGCRPFRKSDWSGMPDWLLEAHKDKVPRIYYDLEEISEFRGYRGRLILKR